MREDDLFRKQNSNEQAHFIKEIKKHTASKDLSDNSINKTLANTELEGVNDKIEIRNEDARSLTFADNFFDVVLSLLVFTTLNPKLTIARHLCYKKNDFRC